MLFTWFKQYFNSRDRPEVSREIKYCLNQGNNIRILQYYNVIYLSPVLSLFKIYVSLRYITENIPRILDIGIFTERMGQNACLICLVNT